VCTLGEELWIDGVSYGTVLREAHGWPLPQLPGCVIVQPGHVFLASQVPHSLDGRYFGPTPVAALTARAVPLVTWR
jgi:type IV secretory pathway protease TraF